MKFSFCALDGTIVLIMWRLNLQSNQNVLKSALLRQAISKTDMNKLKVASIFIQNKLHAVLYYGYSVGVINAGFSSGGWHVHLKTRLQSKRETALSTA